MKEKYNHKRHEYYQNLISKHGLKYFRKKNKRNRENYKLFISELKINGCAICGYNRCESALDFHHVNPRNKKFKINGARISMKSKKISNEINKCILLCANCHREIEELNETTKY